MIRNFDVDYVYNIFRKLKKYYEVYSKKNIFEDVWYKETRFDYFYDYFVLQGDIIKIKQGWTKTTINELKEKGW